MKHRLIVYYDYGMRGVMMFIYARSADEITRAYPELSILDALPTSATPQYVTSVERNLTYDIDAPPTGVLASLIQTRTTP